MKNINDTNREQVVKGVLSFYEVTPDDKKKLDKYRNTIKRKFLRVYPKTNWDDLSENEQLTFICITMKKYMLDRISNPDKIEKKIDAVITEKLLTVNEVIKSQNKRIDDLFTPNADTGRRPYDDLMSDIHDNENDELNTNYYPPEQLRDLKLRVLIDIFETEFDYKFDIEKMEESLAIVYNFAPFDEFEKLSINTEDNRKYAYHKEKLKDVKNYYYYSGDKK